MACAAQPAGPHAERAGSIKLPVASAVSLSAGSAGASCPMSAAAKGGRLQRRPRKQLRSRQAGAPRASSAPTHQAVLCIAVPHHCQLVSHLFSASMPRGRGRKRCRTDTCHSSWGCHTAAGKRHARGATCCGGVRACGSSASKQGHLAAAAAAARCKCRRRCKEARIRLTSASHPPLPHRSWLDQR